MLCVLLVSSTLSFADSAALVKLADRLDSLQAVSYRYRRDLNYGSGGYKHTLEADIHIVFDKTQLPLQIIYTAKGKGFFEKYDGVAFIHRGETEMQEKFPKATYFDSHSVLKNSLVGLSRSLRAVAADSETKVKLSTAKDGQVLLSFTLKEKELGISKPLTTVGYSPTYEITVGQNEVPVKIVQRLKDARDTITTTFDKYNLKASRELPSN